MDNKRTLVAYFSCSGVTANAAKILAETINADIHEIKPEKAYTKDDLNWMNKKSRSTVEMENPASRPAITDRLASMNDYHTVFVGFPVWWYAAPSIINTFLESYDFADKTVVLFATSGGTAIRGCEEKLQKTYPNIKFKSGKLLNGRLDKNVILKWAEDVL